jgi:hypothetical protein
MRLSRSFFITVLSLAPLVITGPVNAQPPVEVTVEGV